MIRKSIFLACCVLISSISLACQCSGYWGSFLKMSQQTPLVALVKINKYLLLKDIANGHTEKTPMSMEVEIIEVYKGKEPRKKIIVWGNPGYLCLTYLIPFKEGEYYTIAFNNGGPKNDFPDVKETDYCIQRCGTFWLTVNMNKSTVTGDIIKGDQSSSTISLSELKANLLKQENNKSASH